MRQTDVRVSLPLAQPATKDLGRRNGGNYAFLRGLSDHALREIRWASLIAVTNDLVRYFMVTMRC